MIDIHNHLLFGVDDGSETLDESISIIANMEKLGYKDIIVTPHYLKDSNYSNSLSNNLNRLYILKDALKDNKINVNLYLGNEIYIDKDIDDLLISNLASSLNNTEYVLVELPMSGDYPEYKEILGYLIGKGYKVILAHPERYYDFQRDFNIIYELEQLGVIFQSNIESITGRYGMEAREMLIRLLNEKKVTFLASDAHSIRFTNHFADCKKELLKHMSSDELNKILNENPKILLNK